MIPPELSSLVSKKGAKNIGIPSTIVILLVTIIMSNGGEYSITNPIDDVKDSKQELKDMKHQMEVIKKKINKLTNAVCNNPDFTCIDR